MPPKKTLVIILVTCICFISTLSTQASAGYYEDFKSVTREMLNTINNKSKTVRDLARTTARQFQEDYTSNKINGSFEDLYPKSFFQTIWGKVLLIGSSAAVIGAITYFTAGSGLASAGPIATWVGTQVGMASGVGSGATAAGLAILGGGTIASGGFGIAGGLAVIAAVSDVGIMIALNTAVDVVPEFKTPYERYRLLKIPLPKKARSQVIADFDAAEELLDQLKNMDMSKAEYVEKAGRIGTKVSDHYHHALDLLQNIDPRSSDAGYDYIARAVLEYNFMEYDAALESITAAMDYTENDAFTGYMLSLVRLTKGDDRALDDASKWLDLVTKEEPSALQPYILQTIVHMDLNQPKVALKKAQAGLRNVGDNFQLYLRAAEIAFYNVNDYETSARLYRAAYDNISQDDLEALCKMMAAVSYYRLGNRDKALTWYRFSMREIYGSPDQVERIHGLWKNLTEQKTDESKTFCSLVRDISESIVDWADSCLGKGTVEAR